MSVYKEKFEEWQKTAKEKLEEIDKQLGLKEKIGEGTRVLIDTAQKGADTLLEGVDQIKEEVEKSEVGKKAIRAAEEAVKTASETARIAWEASEPVRRVTNEASEKAGKVFEIVSEKAEKVVDKTKRKFGETAQKISKTVGYGTNWTQTFNSAVKTARKTADWFTQNPLHLFLMGFSMIVGAGVGAGITLISSHWFFNSVLPVWSLKKVGERFVEYLERQEELIEKGELSTAEKERIEFEREIVRYVEAPLLGAFSFGAGVVMWTSIFSPRGITGAPLSWILRGNPVLEGIWLFGNGLACFKIGYEFLMVSLNDEVQVENLAAQIKAMLEN